MDYAACDAPTIRLGEIAEHYRGREDAGLSLRCRTLLNLVDGPMMRGHTVQVDENHLVVTVPSKLAIEQECGVFFAIVIAEHTFTIVGTGFVIGCTGSDAEGYRVDLRFVVDDKKSRIAIEQLFSSKSSNRIQ